MLKFNNPIKIATTLTSLFVLVVVTINIFIPDTEVAFYSKYGFTTECHGISLEKNKDDKRCFGLLEYFYE